MSAYPEMNSTRSSGRTADQPLRERRAVHLRHDDVGQQQIDLVAVPLEDLARARAASPPRARGSPGAAAPRSMITRTASSSSTSRIVSPRRAGRRRRRRSASGRSAGDTAGKCIVKTRAAPGLALDRDEPVALAHDAVAPTPGRARCPCPTSFVVKNGSNRCARASGGNADAVVDRRAAARSRRRAAGRSGGSSTCERPHARDLEPDAAAGRQRVARVQHQIQDRLLDLRRIDADDGRRSAPARTSSVMSSRISRASMLCRPATVWFRSTSFGSSTCLRLNASSCCVSAAARWPAFWISSRSARSGSSARRSLEQQLGVAENRRQQVVEVVRDAAGQPADALDLLRLRQPLLEQPPIGDVAGDAQVPAGRARARGSCTRRARAARPARARGARASPRRAPAARATRRRARRASSTIRSSSARRRARRTVTPNSAPRPDSRRR